MALAMLAADTAVTVLRTHVISASTRWLATAGFDEDLGAVDACFGSSPVMGGPARWCQRRACRFRTCRRTPFFELGERAPLRTRPCREKDPADIVG